MATANDDKHNTHGQHHEDPNLNEWQLRERLDQYSHIALRAELDFSFAKMKQRHLDELRKEQENRTKAEIYHGHGEHKLNHPPIQGIRDVHKWRDQKRRNQVALRAKARYHKLYSLSKTYRETRPQPHPKKQAFRFNQTDIGRNTSGHRVKKIRDIRPFKRPNRSNFNIAFRYTQYRAYFNPKTRQDKKYTARRAFRKAGPANPRRDFSEAKSRRFKAINDNKQLSQPHKTPEIFTRHTNMTHNTLKRDFNNHKLALDKTPDSFKPKEKGMDRER